MVSFASMSEAVLKKCILQAGIPKGDVSRNIESWRHNSQLPIIPVYQDLAARTSLSLLRFVLSGNSLCQVQVKRTMRKPEVQIGNSG